MLRLFTIFYLTIALVLASCSHKGNCPLIQAGPCPTNSPPTPFAPRWIYTVPSSDLTFLGQVYDPNNDTLTAQTGSPYALEAAANLTNSVALTPDRKFLLVAYFTAVSPLARVAAFKIDATTGVPQAVGSPLHLANGADIQLTNILVHPGGQFAYLLDSNGFVFGMTVNAATGALAQIGATNVFASGSNLSGAMRFSPDGKYLYLAGASQQLFALKVNLGTGALTSVPGSPYAFGGSISEFAADIVADPSSKFLYASNYTAKSVSIYSIGAANGALTPTAGSPFPVNPSGPEWMAIDTTGNYLALVDKINTGVLLYTRNVGTGALTAPIVYPIGTGPAALFIDPSNEFLFVANTVSLTLSAFQFTASTGTLTPFGSPTIPTNTGSYAIFQ